MQCTSEKARRKTLLKLRLAVYSYRVLGEVVADEALDHRLKRQRGIIYFDRSQQALDAGVEHMKPLEADGQPTEVLDRDGVDRASSRAGIGARDRLSGGIDCPTDETVILRSSRSSVCRQGGRARRDDPSEHDDHRCRHGRRRCYSEVPTDKGPFKGDVDVRCSAQSADMARKIGINLPIDPIKVIPLTISVEIARCRRPSHRSTSTISWPSLRFGDRVRLTATAESRAMTRAISHPTSPSWPKVTQADPKAPIFYWADVAGPRPMTPTGSLFGRRAFAQLLLNTGHGYIGWTTSHGSVWITPTLSLPHTVIPMDDLLAAA